MSEGINKVLLIGNLGADPDLRAGDTPERSVLRLRIATTESYFDKASNERKERTDWHNVVLFGKRAEALQKFLQKGSQVAIEGRLQTSSYEKDGSKVYKTDVIATNLILLGGKGNRDADSTTAPRPTGTPNVTRPDRGDKPAYTEDADDDNPIDY